MISSMKAPNRLIKETSPYLLQHAYNPVAWYPWCEEAFIRAQAEDKPIFLSIGYSTCHWCHVMAHESFEDEAVADILNRDFISIKVDREERPDVDGVYMAAAEAMTGGGGWPLSAFLTHEKKPFFTGTYFPKTARYGVPGFKDLLEAVARAWKDDRAALLASAARVDEYLNARDSRKGGGEDVGPERAATAISAAYEPEYGGFGGAPKFPMPHNLLFLMRYAQAANDSDCRAMAAHTLSCMYRGGLFDHVGFGFSRYSTDKKWLAPHFEKMLYDNALLALAYMKLHRLTGEAVYRTVAEKTLTYVLREMTSADGGFYAAQDADSGGKEGMYYLFTPEEVVAVLGEEAGHRFNAYYDITVHGNFEGKNIPNLLNAEDWQKDMDAELSALYAYRRARMRLHTDDKILAGWNGLMIWAFAYAHAVTGDARYLRAANNAADFIETRMREGDTLYASFRDGKRSTAAFAQDYAFYILGLLALHQASLEERRLTSARALMDAALEKFFDEHEGGFYVYASDGEQLIARQKDVYDGALPSANAAFAYALTYLNLLDGGYDAALTKQRAFMKARLSHPLGHGFFFLAELLYERPPRKIVRVQRTPDEAADPAFAADPDAIRLLLREPTKEYPLVLNKTTYYVCENGSCRLEVRD